MPTGSCLCGDVTLSFTGDALSKGLCHCLTCRKLTGSTHATAFLLPLPTDSANPSNFQCASKTNAELRITKAMHETGVQMVFRGCAKCPTTLYKTAGGPFEGTVVVFAGVLDGETEGTANGVNGVNGVSGEVNAERGAGGMEAFYKAPTVEFWVGRRAPWQAAVEGAAQCQTFE